MIKLGPWSKWVLGMDASCGCKVFFRTRQPTIESVIINPNERDMLISYKTKNNPKCKDHK
jgi:hypothetical protein